MYPIEKGAITARPYPGKAYAVLPKLFPNSDIPNSDVFLVPNSEERGSVPNSEEGGSVPNSEGSETIPRHPCLTPMHSGQTFDIVNGVIILP